MHSGIEAINEIIDYIEENITTDIDCGELAAKMNLSVYEFRRIFSFVVGVPIAEYIRKRRLSLAACEIMMRDNVDMIELSEKYGYLSQSAFIKAFNSMHGISPANCKKEKSKIKLFTKPVFELSLSGRKSVEFNIRGKEEFYVAGLTESSTITDTDCCEAVWNSFYEKEIDRKLLSEYAPSRFLAVYVNDRNNENVECTIGARIENKEKISPEFDYVYIGSSNWACFKMSTLNDDIIAGEYSKILYDCLPSANLKRREDIPNLEIYPTDMSEDEFDWEIWIPVEPLETFGN